MWWKILFLFYFYPPNIGTGLELKETEREKFYRKLAQSIVLHFYMALSEISIGKFHIWERPHMYSFIFQAETKIKFAVRRPVVLKLREQLRHKFRYENNNIMEKLEFLIWEKYTLTILSLNILMFSNFIFIYIHHTALLLVYILFNFKIHGL